MMIKVERKEPLACGLSEFGLRNAAVEVRIGGHDRLRQIEETKTGSAAIALLAASPPIAAAPVTPAMTMSAAAFAAAATSLCSVSLRAIATESSDAEMGAAPNLRGNHVLVSGNLVRIDFPVMIDVKQRKKAIRVLLHLLEGKLTIVITVGLPKPIDECVVLAPVRAKWLAHGTDENASMSRS